MLTQSIKVVISKCEELDYKELNKILHDIRYLTCKACNKAMRMYILHNYETMEHKDLYGFPIDVKEKCGKGLDSVIEDKMKEIMNISNTANVAQTRQFVANVFNTDKKKGLFKNDVQSTNFRKDMPIILHNKSYKIIQTEKGYSIECGLFNTAYKNENNLGRITFKLDKLDNNKKATLNKLIAGSYKLGFGQIKQDNKGKWYIMISYSFEPEINQKLDKNKIMGVDVGYNNVFAISIRDEIRKDWMLMSKKEALVSGEELNNFRKTTEAKRRSLLILAKVSGNTNQYSSGSKGHGTKARLKHLEKFNQKIAKFRETMNHKYSKYIIDIALKYNVGVIQLESLENVTKNKNNFLKNWSYYDLINKITYKAEKNGIEVVLIKPDHTSQRCSECGYIDKLNRDGKKDQAKFKCVNCGFEENADINASKNISLPNIESIIEETLKTQKENENKELCV